MEDLVLGKLYCPNSVSEWWVMCQNTVYIIFLGQETPSDIVIGQIKNVSNVLINRNGFKLDKNYGKGGIFG